MGFFFLDIKASGFFSVDNPSLQILIDDEIVSSFTITSTGEQTYRIEVASETGTTPSSIKIRFYDTQAEAGRYVEILNVHYNGNKISDDSTILYNGDETTLEGPFPAIPEPPSVDDFTATIFHDDADSFIALLGTNGNDVIVSEVATRYIRAMDGDDVIFASDFNDTVYAENGTNIIVGGDGNDTIYGGNGNDTIYGGDGNDTIYGGAGNNILVGMSGSNFIQGGSGNDLIFGGSGNDYLVAGGGHNFVFGGAGNDEIYGGAGNDTLIGGSGNNTIYGTAGNNTIYAGNFYDPAQLAVLQHAPATATLLEIDLSSVPGFTNKQPASLTLSVSFDGGATYEDVVFDFTQRPNLPSSMNMLVNHGINGGDDARFAAFDKQGGGFTISIDPGAGDFAPLVGSATYASDSHAPSGMSVAGAIIAGQDAVVPTLHDHEDGNNFVYGGTGDDTIFGGFGNDYLSGGGGNNYIMGGAGNDTIIGGAGNDILIGGTLVFHPQTFFSEDNVTFPTLLETVNISDLDPPGDPALGILKGDLSVSYQTTAEITFVESGAGYDNSLGFYSIDANGNIQMAEMAFANVKQHPAGTTATVSLPGAPDTDFGFFIIADGYRVNNHFNNINFDDGELHFFFDYGGAGQRQANINDNGNDITLVFTDANGDHVLNGPVYHTTERGGSTDINPDGQVHVVSGFTGDDHSTLRIGFEDLPNLGDADYNDVVFDLHIKPNIIAPHPMFDGDDIIYGTGGDNFIYGGGGNNQLHSGTGSDTFMFLSASAFMGSNLIFSFDTALNDALDISDLLSEYDPLSDAIADFVRFTNSGDNSLMEVSADGGGTYQILAELVGLNDLDAASLEAGGHLITA